MVIAMKTNYFLMALAIFVSSCSIAEQKTSIVNDESVDIVAEISHETRTSIGPDSHDSRKVLWSKGDKILVSTGSRSKEQAVYVTEEGGSSSAVFTLQEGSNTLNLENGFFAVYPVEDMYVGKPDPKSMIFINIPSNQNYVEDSFDDKVMPMISDVSYEPVVRFRNIASVLSLSISTDLDGIVVESVLVEAADTISAECGYIPETDSYFIDPSMFGSNVINLDCGDGVSIGSEPIPFNIVVPHRKYSDLSFTVKTTDGMQQVFKLKSGKEIDVKRGTIVEIPLKVTKLQEAQVPIVDLEVTATSFTSFSILLDMQNVSSYLCGLTTANSFYNSLSSGSLFAEMKYMTPYTNPTSYTGSVMNLQESMSDVLIEPGQTYVLWVAPYNSAGSYTEDDVVYIEVKTKSFTPGGSSNVTLSDISIDYTSISAAIYATGAKFIYCMLVSEEFLKQYPTNEERIELLLAPGSQSTIYEKSKEQFVRKFLRPDTKMTMLAVAIDASYRYGSLLIQNFKTDKLPYNSMMVNIDENPSYSDGKINIGWTVTGGDAVGYRYICKESDGHLWKNVLEESSVVAQEKMFLDPGLYYIANTTEPRAVISNLVSGQEYVLIVTAVDSAGNSSVADSYTFVY